LILASDLSKFQVTQAKPERQRDVHV